MNVDTSIPHHFPRRSHVTTHMLVASLALLAIAVWVLFFDGLEGDKRRGTGVLVSFLGLVFTPIWLASTWRSFVNRALPAIEVTSEGVLDRRFLHSFLPWDSVTAITTGQRKAGFVTDDFLVLKVRDIRELRARQSIGQKIDHFTQSFGKSTLELRKFGLQSSFKTLKAVVDAFWDEHNSRSTAHAALPTGK